MGVSGPEDRSSTHQIIRPEDTVLSFPEVLGVEFRFLSHLLLSHEPHSMVSPKPVCSQGHNLAGLFQKEEVVLIRKGHPGSISTNQQECKSLPSQCWAVTKGGTCYEYWDLGMAYTFLKGNAVRSKGL